MFKGLFDFNSQSFKINWVIIAPIFIFIFFSLLGLSSTSDLQKFDRQMLKNVSADAKRTKHWPQKGAGARFGAVRSDDQRKLRVGRALVTAGLKSKTHMLHVAAENTLMTLVGRLQKRKL